MMGAKKTEKGGEKWIFFFLRRRWFWSWSRDFQPIIMSIYLESTISQQPVTQLNRNEIIQYCQFHTIGRVFFSHTCNCSQCHAIEPRASWPLTDECFIRLFSIRNWNSSRILWNSVQINRFRRENSFKFRGGRDVIVFVALIKKPTSNMRFSRKCHT